MSNLITEVDILDESKECFLTFAEEVLTDRAVPNIEDGLLSVHRKLIWTMEELLKLNNKSKYKKSASVVGSTLASSYYHGDAACYGALCKLAQVYLMRYPLIDGDGNFGSQEGNGMEASARYTNCRPSKYSDLMMIDFKKDTVPLKETYNGEYMEPVILPSLLPNALVNGREAIAIGLSHNSLPNNLTEVCNGIIEYIKNRNITLEEIMQYIKGPDFPLPGTVINKKDIEYAFRTGHSNISLKVRGEYYIDKDEIIFTSIPYRTYRNKIKEQINKNIEKLEEVIDDFSDLSNVGENRLVFHVKKGINPEKAVLRLFSLTDLQTTLSYNMNFIVNGTPKMCNLIDLVKYYVIHQNNVMSNAAKFDKNKAEKRIHILNGLILAVDKINEVITLIKQSENKQNALNKLINFLSIDEIQASAILDMKLGRLTKIDKNELIKELKEKESIVKECDKIILFQDYRDEKLIGKLIWLRDNYGDERRTKLLDIEVSKEEEEIEEIVPEDIVVMFSQSSNIKRISKSAFNVQHKRGKGIKNKDDIQVITTASNTTDNLYLFTLKGKAYKVQANNVPEATNASKGLNVSNFIKIEPDDKVIAMTSLPHGSNAKYVIFFTKNGLVKKTSLEEYKNMSKGKGIAAISLKENDSIANIVFCNDEDMVVVTKNGMAIKFESKFISPIGRVTKGVKSIALKENDEVLIGLPIYNKDDLLAMFTKNGYGKKIQLNELPIQARGGRGLTISDDLLVSASIINNDDNLLITGKTNIIYIKSEEVPLLSRTSIGNIINDGEIVSVIKL